MAIYTGVTGKISIKKGATAAKDIVHMANWTVDLSKEMIEAISFGSNYKEKVPGIKDWTASFDGTADFATESGQKDLVDAYEDDSVLEAGFYLDATTFLKGNCYICGRRQGRHHHRAVGQRSCSAYPTGVRRTACSSKSEEKSTNCRPNWARRKLSSNGSKCRSSSSSTGFKTRRSTIL